MNLWSENPTLATAIVGAVGILVGGVVTTLGRGLIDRWIQTDRLRFERESARQQKLIDAQWKLLDDLAEICWKFRYDAIRVLWFWQEGKLTEYKSAADEYVKSCWTTLSRIRFHSTQAGRLFSLKALHAVEAFYQRVEILDEKVEKAIAAQDNDTRDAVSKEIYPILDNEVRLLIADLIMQLNLDISPSSASRSVSSAFKRGGAGLRGRLSHEQSEPVG
jgi:hypothetical protein